MSTVQATFTNSALPLEVRQEALVRANADPGIPRCSGATKSFWINQPSSLATIQSSSLPEYADIVIIGSGISGTSTAKALLETTEAQADLASTVPKPQVMVLEAREVCSGATGRNGGHIHESGENFVDLEAEYGLEAAKSIMKFRLSHLAEILAEANSLGIAAECQARKVEFVLACFSDNAWQDNVRRIRRLKEALPEETREWKLIEKADIPKEYCIAHAQGLVTGPAGAIWPYKFVTAVLKHLATRYGDRFTLETNTPVVAVTKNTDNTCDRQFTVHTTRGTVHARHVIHCTNAHIGHLVPILRGNIYPVRGQMSAQTPGSSFPHQGDNRSWIFAYEKGFDYLTQLPLDEQSSGEMMLGGGFVQSEWGGLQDVGIASDHETSLNAGAHLSRVLNAVFGESSWGSVDGASVKQMWTGTMGWSADGLPWVGRIPESMTGPQPLTTGLGDGQGGAEWMVAAFSGDGMVHAWLCGKALAVMLLEHDLGQQRPGQPVWFPSQMIITEERMRRACLPKQVSL